MAFEEHRLTTQDGGKIHSGWLPAAEDTSEPAAPVALFLHGSGGNISLLLDTASMSHELGWSVLRPDYRGYGSSEGTPSEQGTYADARAAYDLLVNVRRVDPQRIVIIGRSLGGWRS